jgi:lysyl-tRNA synthetase class 2
MSPWKSAPEGRRLAKIEDGRFLQAFSRIAKPQPTPQPSCNHARPPLPASTEPSPWWHPDRHRDRRSFLLARGRIQAAVRSWFLAQGFVEVETAALQVSPGNETHLHAFATELVGPGGERRPLYLHTSPEFACKKLLAAGEERIFTLAQVFRNRERGALHHPAFTMLEWYRAGASCKMLMEDCAALLAVGVKAAGTAALTWRGLACDAYGIPEYLPVSEAFRIFAGVDLVPESASHCIERDELMRQAAAAGIRCAADDTWSDVFSRILVERIEPRLAEWRRPCFLLEYPMSEAALAAPSSRDPRVADRFELYACGVELVNGYFELTHAAELRLRLEAQMAEKERRYGERYPLDEDFLAALAHMPPAAGAALGFDRLVMLATGASHIEQVVWTPLPEPGI